MDVIKFRLTPQVWLPHTSPHVRNAHICRRHTRGGRLAGAKEVIPGLFLIPTNAAGLAGHGMLGYSGVGWAAWTLLAKSWGRPC